jgi:hypothetical protein
LAHQPITLAELIAGARAVEWDFTNWCYASGHNATDAHTHLMFECLLAYASRPEGRAGLQPGLLHTDEQQNFSREKVRSNVVD